MSGRGICSILDEREGERERLEVRHFWQRRADASTSFLTLHHCCGAGWAVLVCRWVSLSVLTEWLFVLGFPVFGGVVQRSDDEVVGMVVWSTGGLLRWPELPLSVSLTGLDFNVGGFTFFGWLNVANVWMGGGVMTSSVSFFFAPYSIYHTCFKRTRIDSTKNRSFQPNLRPCFAARGETDPFLSVLKLAPVFIFSTLTEQTEQV